MSATALAARSRTDDEERTTRNRQSGTDDADAAITTILSLVKASRYKVPGANQCVYIGIYCQMKKPKTTKKRVAI